MRDRVAPLSPRPPTLRFRGGASFGSPAATSVLRDLTETGALAAVALPAILSSIALVAVLARAPRSSGNSTATGRSPAVLSHGALGLALARLLARRVHHTTQRMFELSALSATGRVYAELLRISEPSDNGETRYIRPKPTWTVLAQRVNTSRETASRTISDLEKRGLLRRVEGGFELVDPDQLSRLSSTS